MVSSDWLTWQRLIQDGKPTLLLEQALEHWDADGGLAEEFMLRVSDPAYEDGTDMTMFHGTSLGRAFLTPAILLRAAALRIGKCVSPTSGRLSAE